MEDFLRDLLCLCPFFYFGHKFNGTMLAQIIHLNGLIFMLGAGFALMGIILFVMTALGASRKKLTGTITQIKANMVSKTAVVQVAGPDGIREVEAELRSRSKVGDPIALLVEKKTGKYVEFNPKRLMTVGFVFIVGGGLAMLPGILMNV